MAYSIESAMPLRAWSRALTNFTWVTSREVSAAIFDLSYDFLEDTQPVDAVFRKVTGISTAVHGQRGMRQKGNPSQNPKQILGKTMSKAINIDQLETYPRQNLNEP